MQETLFIEHYPLRVESDRYGGVRYDPIIRLVITHGNVTEWNSKLHKQFYDWAFDTCFTGELITSAEFLRSRYDLFAGNTADVIPRGVINKHLRPNGTRRFIAQGFGKVDRMPVYSANAWLVSNLSHLRDLPIRIPLAEGVAVQPERNRNLIGRDLLLGSGIRVQIDFDSVSPSLSMWVPNKLLPISRA